MDYNAEMVELMKRKFGVELIQTKGSASYFGCPPMLIDYFYTIIYYGSIL